MPSDKHFGPLKDFCVSTLLLPREEMIPNPSPNAALRWFQRAALTNYPPAENDLAVLMIKGIGVQQDPVAGARWMRKAADSNLAALNAPRHLLPAWHWRRSR
jgi:TPR repeat protein